MSALRVFPARPLPTPDQLEAACRDIDGTELVEAFLFCRHELGMTTAAALRSPLFRGAFMTLLHEVRDRAMRKGGAV